MKVVIIGAGQTGRGFLGRLAYLSNAEITYLDCNQQLIDALRGAGSYEISFFGNRRPAICVQHFECFHIDDEAACSALCNADLIFISVLAENLKGLIPVFLRALGENDCRIAPIVVCENGINPSQVLRRALPKDVEITEGVLLCTTCNDGLDICSQDLDFLPYDASKLSMEIPLKGFVREERFDILCRRKIYTYNCLSASICYPGAEKGYFQFELAANDPEIKKNMLELRTVLDQVIAREYEISIEEQSAFSQMAVDKFTSMEMKDSIERNARNALRKLGAQERLIAPMKLAVSQGQSIDLFLRLIVSALKYGIKEGSIDRSCMQRDRMVLFLQETCGIEDVSVAEKIYDLYSKEEIMT